MDPTTRPKFGDPELGRKIQQLRAPDDRTNLLCLTREYLGIAAVIGGAVAFAECRKGWGLPWAANVPVFALAIFLVGGLQHRLAGLAHESAHYTLLRNKFWNDFVADVFCLFPILGTIHFYRLFHLAHHQYTNDPERDPDLVNMGHSKGIDAFPMPRSRFVLAYFFRMLFAPRAFARYGWDYIYVNVLGKGGNVYMRRVPGGDADSAWPRLGTTLGLIYIFGFNGLLWPITASGHPGWLPPVALLGMALATAVTYALPARFLYRSPLREPYSSRFAGSARLVYFTLLMATLAYVRWATDGRSAIYVLLLWIVPMSTTFFLFMLLRDVYQHANADAGRLTNSRVFFCDPLTRWAVFVYGQDMHIPHHLFPTVPHHRLRQLHELLKSEHGDYAAQVVECHGTFGNDRGLPTILDVLAEPRTAALPSLCIPEPSPDRAVAG